MTEAQFLFVAGSLIIMAFFGFLVGQSVEARRYVSKLADAYNRGKAHGRTDTAAIYARQTLELGQPEGSDTWMPGNRV